MSATASRTAALEVVTRVRERGSFAHETLDGVLKMLSLDERDRAFATRLAYETIASRGTVDEAVSHHLRADRPLEPVVADALAVSACEILFLSTPARAAVSQGVELVRGVKPAAAGLANAVLRRVSEEAGTFPWGDPDSDIDALARLHRHPRWIAEMLVSEIGRDAASAVMAADNEPAPLFLATIDPALASTEALEAVGVPVRTGPISGSFVAVDPAAAVRSQAVADRRMLVVDAGAQFAVRVLPLADDSRVLEIGAGRGTKSLLIAAAARDAGLGVALSALDSHAFKLERLAADADRLGLSGIDTVVADATTDLSEAVRSRTYDAVLIDAPCSGLGTLRRHPDRRWRATPDEIGLLGSVGSSLIANTARLVKPGGFMVYSTCTIARGENQDVVEGFLASPEGADFRTDSLSPDVPDAWRRFVTPEGWFQSLPEVDGPDGHFVARLVRT